MKKIIALLLALLTITACFAGCSEEPAPAKTPEPQPAGTDAPESEPAVESKGTVVVGYTLYEPMNYLDDDGNLVGFDTELAEAVFDKLGYEIIFQEIDWSQKYTDLDSGAIDCIWNGFTCNTADNDGILRSEKVDFSFNYMENQQVVVAKADSGIATAADLNGKMAAVESGSAGESYAEEFEGIYAKGFLKQTECLFEVISGNVDVAILDAQLAKSYVGKGDYADLVIVDGLESAVEFYAIGFKKGSDLTAQVNAALAELGADGTIAALAEKYDVVNTTITDFSDQQ